MSYMLYAITYMPCAMYGYNTVLNKSRDTLVLVLCSSTGQYNTPNTAVNPVSYP
jgi:hypothetical protein